MSDITPIDVAKLYRIEMFTDGENGDIRVLVPVVALPEGFVSDDSSRPSKFYSTVRVVLSFGAQKQEVPVNFEIEAGSLAEACSKFGECAEKASSEFVAKIEEQRRTAPRVLTPPGRMQ